MANLTLREFANRCRPAARDLQDRLHRYVSSPQEHNLFMESGLRLIYLKLGGADG